MSECAHQCGWPATPWIMSSRSDFVTRQPSDVMPRGITRRPRPLKIEAAEMAGNVDDFADEIKPGDGPCFEGFRGKPRGIDAPKRHFRGAVTFGSIRPHAPLFDCRCGVGETLVGEIGKARRTCDRAGND